MRCCFGIVLSNLKARCPLFSPPREENGMVTCAYSRDTIARRFSPASRSGARARAMAGRNGCVRRFALAGIDAVSHESSRGDSGGRVRHLLSCRHAGSGIRRYHDGIPAARGSDDGDPLRLGRCRVIAAPSVAPWDRRAGVARGARNSLRPVWRFRGPAPGARGRCGRRATGAARL
jgi:hypothetical protein